MNAPNQWYQDDEVEQEPAYQVQMRRDSSEAQPKPKRGSLQAKSRQGGSVNGMHRRRNKRFAW